MRWRFLGLGNYSFYAVMGAVVWCLLLLSCGTGIETGRQITDKDVRRVLEHAGNESLTPTLEAYIDSLPAWKQGKRFWVTDDKVREMLLASDVCNPDTLYLANHVLIYAGCVNNGLLMGEKSKVDILFQDASTARP